MHRVGIITLTFKDRALFATLACRNVCKQTLQPDCWIVCADESVECYKAYDKLERRPDVFLQYKADTIGEKRNFAVSHCDCDIIAFQDDDDVYNAMYLETAVRELTNRRVGLVGCSHMLVVYPKLEFKACYVQGKYVHEATACFTRNHWEMYLFEHTSRGEGKQMCKGLYWNDMDIRHAMICIAHCQNSFPKDQLLQESNKV
ncbi:unnamed protein product, partial [Phaeothamnion confervicola]